MYPGPHAHKTSTLPLSYRSRPWIQDLKQVCLSLSQALDHTPLCGLCQYGLREFCLRTKLLEETVRSLICSNVLASGWSRKSSQVKGRAVIHPPIPPVHCLPTLLTFSAKPSAFLCLSLPWLLFYGFNINNLPGIVKPSTAQTARKTNFCKSTV